MSEMDEKLQVEYDATVDEESRMSSLLGISADSFTRERRIINLKEVGLSAPIKMGRQRTMIGLSKSVAELGVVKPIDVILVNDSPEEDDYRYLLLDGLRRMYGALRNSMTEIEATVWVFDDLEQAKDIALPLSLYLNKTQKHQWSEIWGLYQVLEETVIGITPANMESLLQLEAGEAMKLKDVMLSGYSEVTEALLNGDKTLDGAYKMLQKLRKEENMLEIEDTTGISDISEDAGSITNSDNMERLSEQDVMELLEMVDTMKDLDVSDADFSELNTGLLDETHQKVGEREPVDPAIRQGTFQRDKYRCRCCGTGGVAFLSTLVYHHVIPVHCSGADSVENGLTLCDSCHLTLHCAEKSGGKLPMTREQFDEYNEVDQIRIKEILKYAKIAVEAAKRQGKSKEEIRAEAQKSSRHRMPGENWKENQAGYAASQGMLNKD